MWIAIELLNLQKPDKLSGARLRAGRPKRVPENKEFWFIITEDFAHFYILYKGYIQMFKLKLQIHFAQPY